MVTNLKLVAGDSNTYTIGMLGSEIVQVTPPVTNDSPFYIHISITSDPGTELFLLTANDMGNDTAHVVLPGETKTFGPYQADTAPYGFGITGSGGNYSYDFSVFQSGGNKLTPVVISRDSVLVDVSDESEAYTDLIDYWDLNLYPDFAPTNLTCAVYVVIYAKDVDWLSVLPTGSTTGGSNSALIVNRGESIVLGPYSRENMPVVYTPTSAGNDYLVSLDVVKRGS